MSQTKRISRRTHLKRADTRPLNPQPMPNLTERARAARVEAVREVINDPAFNLDGAFARAVTRLIERHVG